MVSSRAAPQIGQVIVDSVITVAFAAAARSDLVQLAAPDPRDEVVPFGVRQPDAVLLLANTYAALGNFDGRAFAASGTKRHFDRFHRSLPSKFGSPGSAGR
jgi:hypothetical protein